VRPVPRYDFCASPHGGYLFYERLGWNISGDSWRQAAKKALQNLRF